MLAAITYALHYVEIMCIGIARRRQLPLPKAVHSQRPRPLACPLGSMFLAGDSAGQDFLTLREL
ncbi:hypothetical protein CH275_11950 [Rhodococcus sp. 06-235-1A]|nr:hypothetical protein CH275_11950 [Rhodococcus sp. 06-235-1A]